MKKGFNSKPHLICSTDQLRIAMNHIYFKDGFLMATDGFAAIKQHLSLHDFDDDEIALMNDKFLHRSIFPDLYKAEILRVRDSLGIYAIAKSGTETFHKWSWVNDRFPDLESILTSDAEETALATWAIDPVRLNNLYSAMPAVFKSGVKVTFTGARKKIIVEPNDYSSNQIAIIMPVQLNDEWFDIKRGINHPLIKTNQSCIK